MNSSQQPESPELNFQLQKSRTRSRLRRLVIGALIITAFIGLVRLLVHDYFITQETSDQTKYIVNLAVYGITMVSIGTFFIGFVRPLMIELARETAPKEPFIAVVIQRTSPKRLQKVQSSTRATLAVLTLYLILKLSQACMNLSMQSPTSMTERKLLIISIIRPAVSLVFVGLLYFFIYRPFSRYVKSRQV